MTSLKRIGIVVAVAALLILLSQSFVVVNIKDRAIAIGIGIDYLENQYEVTLEVLSGSPTGEQPTMQTSKLLSGKGETISLAVQSIYEQTGQLPSLGQCTIVLLGKDFYSSCDLANGLAYLVFSDAFKDGTIVACYDGKAKDAFGYVTALQNSIGFALSQQLQNSDECTAIPRTFLEQFINRQYGEGSRSAILNYVTSTLTGEIDMQSNKPLAVFDCTRSVVFTDYKYVKVLSQEEQRGYNMLQEPLAFDTFYVSDQQEQRVLPDTVVVGIASKDLKSDIEWEDNSITFNVECNLHVERMRTDNTGHIFRVTAKTDDKINEGIKKQVEQQVKQKILAAVQGCKQSGADYLMLSTALYRKYGKKWIEFAEQNPTYLYDVLKTEIKVEVS